MVGAGRPHFQKRVFRDLIRTFRTVIEERIAIEDRIKHITKKAESLQDRIDAVTTANQSKLLAYKKFLEINLEAVNRRIKDLQ